MTQLKGNETMKEIRAIIKANECLHDIKSIGKGRSKQVLIKEINEKLASLKQSNDENEDDEMKKAQQTMQFNMTDILLFYQNKSLKAIRLAVEKGINEHCDSLSNAVFKNKQKIALYTKGCTKQNIMQQIKEKWNKLSCDELNVYESAKRKIYIKHHEDAFVLFKGGSYLCDVRDDWNGEMYYENKWRFVINDYKNDYSNNENIVFEYKLYKQTRIIHQWKMDENEINLDEFCQKYEINFKSNGFVDALGWWPKAKNAPDWRHEFDDNQSIIIHVNARDVKKKQIIASDQIEFRIVDIARDFLIE